MHFNVILLACLVPLREVGADSSADSSVSYPIYHDNVMQVNRMESTSSKWPLAFPGKRDAFTPDKLLSCKDPVAITFVDEWLRYENGGKHFRYEEVTLKEYEDGAIYNADDADTVVLCGVGCTAVSSPLECGNCPSEYEDCGEFGGCSPLSEEGSFSHCSCLEGFSGRYCTKKTYFSAFDVGFLFLFTALSCLTLFMAMIKGPNGRLGTPSGKRKMNYTFWDEQHERIQGFHLSSEYLFVVLTFLQLAGGAFDTRSIPWTRDALFPKLASLASFDFAGPAFEDVFGFTLSTTHQTLAFAGIGFGCGAAMIANDPEWYDHMERKNKLGDVILKFIDVFLIAGVRMMVTSVFGCTVRGGLATLDTNPETQCLTTGYAATCLIGIFMLHCITQAWQVIAPHMSFLELNPKLPCKERYARFFVLNKLLSTMFSVTMGRWHPRFSSVVLMLNHMIYLGYTVIDAPYQHDSANCYAVYGEAFNVISYLCALIATSIDDVDSEVSIWILNALTLVVSGLFAAAMAYAKTTGKEIFPATVVLSVVKGPLNQFFKVISNAHPAASIHPIE